MSGGPRSSEATVDDLWEALREVGLAAIVWLQSRHRRLPWPGRRHQKTDDWQRHRDNEAALIRAIRRIPAIPPTAQRSADAPTLVEAIRAESGSKSAIAALDLMFARGELYGVQQAQATHPTPALSRLVDEKAEAVKDHEARAGVAPGDRARPDARRSALAEDDRSVRRVAPDGGSMGEAHRLDDPGSPVRAGGKDDMDHGAKVPIERGSAEATDQTEQAMVNRARNFWDREVACQGGPYGNTGREFLAELVLKCFRDGVMVGEQGRERAIPTDACAHGKTLSNCPVCERLDTAGQQAEWARLEGEREAIRKAMQPVVDAADVAMTRGVLAESALTGRRDNYARKYIEHMKEGFGKWLAEHAPELRPMAHSRICKQVEEVLDATNRCTEANAFVAGKAAAVAVVRDTDATLIRRIEACTLDGSKEGT